MENKFKRGAARKIQDWMKSISIQSVGRSIPASYYEPKIPEEVLKRAEEWKRGKTKAKHKKV